MKMALLYRARLQSELMLQRIGWGNSLACALALGCALVWWGMIPQLQHQEKVLQGEINRAMRLSESPQALPATPQSQAQERLQQFYANLGDSRYAEQQVKTLFALATDAGLMLRQAEYRSASDRNGRFHTYQITLPVRGTYREIRQFCDQILLTIPFASLDEISVRRETISNPRIDAKLRITLYLGKPAQPGKWESVAAEEDGQS